MCDVVLTRQGRAANRGAARQQQRVALMMSGLLRVFVGVDAYVRLPTLELDNWYYVCLFIG
jgi:hypothetical protein